MLTGNANNIFGFLKFTGALQSAAKGVVHIQTSGSGSGISTGWMITNDLVVAPGFAIPVEMQPSDKIICRFDDAGENITGITAIALPFEGDAGPDQIFDITLIRLTQPQSERALSLCLDELLISSPAIILQYAGGSYNLQISTGKLLSIENDTIRYDADTMPGSSGAPVLNGMAQVKGMHMIKYTAAKKRGQTSDADQALAGSNGGPSISGILARLKLRPEWAEIAAFHNLAYSSPPPSPPPANDVAVEKKMGAGITPSLLPLHVALRWHVNPTQLPEHGLELLKPLVTEARPEKWSMKLAERQRLIDEAGSLNKLKKAYQLLAIPDDAGQRVIGRILEGPPYSIDKLEEAELPYWLQAVRWFGDAIPELPDAAAVNLELEQRRIRSRLQQIAGPDFRGRKAELAEMQKWYDAPENGPLLVTGIGGVGKSALISKFLLNQSPDTVFFWLDFDRADLSPDDAMSVLNMVAGQAYLQIDGFGKMEWSGTGWQANATAFAVAATALLAAKDAVPPLMVLDGFEVAQYSKKYNEIWQVLEHLMKALKRIKVIVSGRAPVPALQLNNYKAEPLNLKGMDNESAAGWLMAHGIADNKVIEKVLKISGGVPLVLRLAARLIDDGGAVGDLPDSLPESMIEGYLYQRILDRVIDPLLQPLARDLLAVRTVSVAMLEQLFAGSLPPDMGAPEVFERLMREMSLVNEADPAATVAIAAGQGLLHLRPELRSATLKLLEREDAARVKSIHEKAAAWYAALDVTDVHNRAELIYHYLHLARFTEADTLWQDDCLRLLEGAGLDFGENNTKAVQWLAAKKATEPKAAANSVWEQDALARIKDALYRDKRWIATEILKEQSERSPGSPLLVFDALSLMKSGQLQEAETLLDKNIPENVTLRQQHQIVQALIARNRGDAARADTCLLELEQPPPAEEKQPWNIQQLLIRSARIRLQVLPEKELALYRFMNEGENAETDFLKKLVNRFLISADVILPAFCEHLDAVSIRQESFTAHLEVPYGPSGLHEFKALLNRKRKHNTGYKYDVLPPSLNLTGAEHEWTALLAERMDKLTASEKIGDANKEIILRLALAGLKKWMLATNDLFLSQASAYLFQNEGQDDFSRLALAGAFAGLRGEQLAFASFAQGTDALVEQAVLESKRVYSMKLPVTDNTLQLAIDVLQTEQIGKQADYLLQYIPELVRPEHGMKMFPIEWLTTISDQGVFSVLYYLLGPDPLEVLCRQVLGLPPDYEL